MWELKLAGAIALTGINAALLGWAVVAWRHRAPMPDGYYRVLTASPLVAAFQAIMGLLFLNQGMRAPGMHIFYGCLVAAGAVTQVALGRRTALGHRYRARPHVHLFLALFVGLLAARAWMAA
ncbi:MAG TPA: hypothetical protein VNT75_29035 [Symbiobacteriaceae bacterium]|nr:hypothetical protein [Symbiobacteriaceae bacterium]